MNKAVCKYLFPLLLVFLFLVACHSPSSTERSTPLSSPTTSSKSEVHFYTNSSLTAIKKKIDFDQAFYLYVGRPTCPYCNRFLPKLEEAIRTTNVPVYYLNTDEETDTAAVTDFLTTQDIQTVPYLAYYRGNQRVAFLEKGSESSLKEIETFLMTYAEEN